MSLSIRGGLIASVRSALSTPHLATIRMELNRNKPQLSWTRLCMSLNPGFTIPWVERIVGCKMLFPDAISKVSRRNMAMNISGPTFHGQCWGSRAGLLNTGRANSRVLNLSSAPRAPPSGTLQTVWRETSLNISRKRRHRNDTTLDASAVTPALLFSTCLISMQAESGHKPRAREGSCGLAGHKSTLC